MIDNLLEALQEKSYRNHQGEPNIMSFELILTGIPRGPAGPSGPNSPLQRKIKSHCERSTVTRVSRTNSSMTTVCLLCMHGHVTYPQPRFPIFSIHSFNAGGALSLQNTGRECI